MWRLESNFPIIHKVGNVGIIVFLKFENKLDAAITWKLEWYRSQQQLSGIVQCDWILNFQES